MRARITVLASCFVVLCFACIAGAGQSLQITSGPKVEHVDSNSAVIAWSTNVSAGTVLKYGTAPDSLNETTQMPWGALTHRVTLHNLRPNTTYYFQALSEQARGSGTSARSVVSQFRTAVVPGSPSAADDKPSAPDNSQVVAGPIPQKLTADSADIYWETDQPTENVVKYGTSEKKLDQSVNAESGQQTHRVTLKYLQPKTTYYYAVERADGSMVSSGHFETQAQSAQDSNDVRITNGPSIGYLASNVAKISWSTNVASSSVVKYGTDPHLLNLIAHAPWGSTNHNLTLANLNPNTKYYFQIESGQGQGTASSVESETYSFQTIKNGQSAMVMQH